MHKIINPSYHQLNIFMEDFFSATMKKKTFSLSANNSFLFFQNVGEDRTLANWFKWSTFYAVSFSHFILWLKNYPECISIIFNAIRIHYARGKGGGYNFRFSPWKRKVVLTFRKLQTFQYYLIYWKLRWIRIPRKSTVTNRE